MPEKKNMKTLVIFIFSLLAGNVLLSQNILDKAKEEIKKTVGNSGNGLSNDDIITGLREALNQGSTKASGSASKIDGFFKNPAIKIPFPPEVAIVEKTARQLGLHKQTDAFVKSLNRAAEEASKEAAPILLSAIKSMTITDGLSILNGGETAATDYLKGKTSAELTARFTPIVKRAIAKAQVAKYWKPVVKKYNKIPGVQKKNPNLESYITEKTVQGLFKLIAQEEVNIRKDPAARATDILKRVFGK